MKKMKYYTMLLLCLGITWLSACQGSQAPADATTENRKSLAPERVDIRGSIIANRYSDGQVVLEVEGIPPSINSTYDRAYVLVLPTTQIVDQQGRSISYNELRQGQNVAILLRGGGRGNRVGIGVARRVWLEDIF